jgi:hypothetical protein
MVVVWVFDVYVTFLCVMFSLSLNVAHNHPHLHPPRTRTRTRTRSLAHNTRARTQGYQVLALASGSVPSSLVAPVLNHLLTQIATDGYHLSTGLFFSRFAFFCTL